MNIDLSAHNQLKKKANSKKSKSQKQNLGEVLKELKEIRKTTKEPPLSKEQDGH